MTTFFMFGKYSPDSLKKVSAERTRKATDVIQAHGGRLKSAYVLLGDKDLVFIVSLPNATQATLISIQLTKITGISFTTSIAIPAEEFDRQFNKNK